MAFAVERGTDPDGRWLMADRRCAFPTREEQSRLCVPPGKLVVRVVRVRSSQGRNDLLDVAVMAEGTTSRRIASGLAEEHVSIVPAPRWVADLLEVPASTLLLKLDRIVRTPSGVPLEWRLVFGLAAASGGTTPLRRKIRVPSR